MSESIYDLYRCGEQDPALSYLHLPPALRLEGPWTSLISLWCSSAHYQYYHWMLDGLPRLALLDFFPPETRILIPAPLMKYHRESLELLGLFHRCRVTPEQHLEVEDYYFSSPTAMTGCTNPYAAQFLRGKFLGLASKLQSYPEKIYIPRGKATRAPINEPRLIEFLQNEGWTIVQAENYPLADQIALFSRARIVCAVHGAGLTNLLWCQPHTRVLELFASNYLNACYECISASLDLEYSYRICPANAETCLKIELDEFVKEVRRLG